MKKKMDLTKMEYLAKTAVCKYEWAKAAAVYAQLLTNGNGTTIQKGKWFSNRSLCHLKLLEPKKALDDANKSIQLGFAKGLCRRGQVCERQFCNSGAIEAYEEYKKESKAVHNKAEVEETIGSLKNRRDSFLNYVKLVIEKGDKTKCGLCFRVFESNTCNIEKTKSHAIPHSSYKAFGVEKLYCTESNEVVAAAKLTSQKFTFCQPKNGVKNVTNCETGVMEAGESQLLKFVENYTSIRFSTSDTPLEYGPDLHHGVASVAYRTMLDEGFEVVNNASFQKLVIRCRDVTAGYDRGIFIFPFFCDIVSEAKEYATKEQHGYEQLMKSLHGMYICAACGEISWVVSLGGALMLVTLDDGAFTQVPWYQVRSNIKDGKLIVAPNSKRNENLPKFMLELINRQVLPSLQAMSMRSNNKIDYNSPAIASDGITSIVLPPGMTIKNFKEPDSPYEIEAEGKIPCGDAYILGKKVMAATDDTASKHMIVVCRQSDDYLPGCYDCLGFYFYRDTVTDDVVCKFSNTNSNNFVWSLDPDIRMEEHILTFDCEFVGKRSNLRKVLRCVLRLI